MGLLPMRMVPMTRPYNPPRIGTTSEYTYNDFRRALGFDIALVPSKLSDYERFEHRWAESMADRYKYRKEIANLIAEKNQPVEILIQQPPTTRNVRLED